MKAAVPQPEPPLMLTALQVAQRLQVGIRTVYRLARRGQIPAPVRFNRKVARWSAAQLERHVEQLADEQPGAGE